LGGAPTCDVLQLPPYQAEARNQAGNMYSAMSWDL
jgi:hypothetical protein